MSGHGYAYTVQERLERLAYGAVDERIALRDALDEAFVEELATRLFRFQQRARRKGGRSRMKERVFSELPTTQKGKYLKLVRTAITELTT